MCEFLNKFFSGLGKAVETVPELYDDGLKPAVQEAGKTLKLLPATINAVLAPLRQWIDQQEYNIAESQKLLEQKLENVAPESIVTPEAYVAVPAFQAIAYCMSNEELYDLFANLLAKSMVSGWKEKVHPSFVEIIKQLSPNDALVLREIFNSSPIIEAATIAIVLKRKGAYMVGSPQPVKYSDELVYNIHCSSISEDQISISVNNLQRLGLVDLHSDYSPSDVNFDFVNQTSLYLEFEKLFEELKGTDEDPERIQINRKYISLNSLGKLFCEICIAGIS